MSSKVPLPRTKQLALIGAVKLIDSDDRWCKGQYAFGKDGQFVHLSSQDAHSFCGRGAIFRACEDQGFSHDFARDTLRYVESQMSPWGCDEFATLPMLNDCPTTNREDIVRLFNWCIDRLEEQCQS